MVDEDARELEEWERERLAGNQAHRELYPGAWYPGQAEENIRACEREVEENFTRIARHEAGHAIAHTVAGSHITFLTLKAGIGTRPHIRVRGVLMPRWIHRLSAPESRAELARECQCHLAGEVAERLEVHSDETEALLSRWDGMNQDTALPQERYELRELCGVVFRFFNADVSLARAFILEQYQSVVAILHEMSPAIDALVDRLQTDRSLVGRDVAAIITAACLTVGAPRP